MPKAAKKRRANRQRKERGLCIQTSGSGKYDLHPSEGHEDDVFSPKTPVQASEGDEKERVSETEVGTPTSRTDEPAIFQGELLQNGSAENLGFGEFDASRIDEVTPSERLTSMLKESRLGSYELSRGFPMNSSEAMIRWEGLLTSEEFLGRLESVESSKGFPMSASAAVMERVSLGRADGHEVLRIPLEQNGCGRDTVLDYFVQNNFETWIQSERESGDGNGVETCIQSREETVDGYEVLQISQEQNRFGRGTVLGCSEEDDVAACFQSIGETVNGYEALQIPQEQNGVGRVMVLGSSEQDGIETCIESKEETVDGYGALQIPQEQNVLGNSTVLACSNQDDVENCIQSEKETVDGHRVLQITNKQSELGRSTVLGCAEQDSVETCIQYNEETVQDVKCRELVENVASGNPYSSTFGEKPFLEALSVLNDSELDVVEARNISRNEIVEDVKNRGSYFEQDHIETCIQSQEATVEDANNRDPVKDVTNGNPFSSSLGEKSFLEVLAVFNDANLDVIKASNMSNDRIVEDMKNKERHFEQDYVQTCIQCKAEAVEDAKNRNPFSSSLGEKPSLESLVTFNDSELDVVESSNTSKDEIVEDVTIRESYSEQDYVETHIECMDETVEDVKNRDLAEDDKNGNPLSSTLGEKQTLEVLAVFNDLELNLVETSYISNDEIMDDLKNRESYFKQDYGGTYIQCKEDPVEDVKNRGPVEDFKNGKPFSSTVGGKLSSELLPVFNDSELNVVEASNKSKDEIMKDGKNGESYLEQDYVETCIQCKEETVEDAKNTDPVEDVKTGNLFPSTLGENPSLEVLTAFNNFELDLVESSKTSKDEIVEDGKNTETLRLEELAVFDNSELGIVEVRNGSKVAIVDDTKTRDTFTSTLEEMPPWKVLVVFDNSQVNAVEAGNRFKDDMVVDVKSRDTITCTLEEMPSLEVSAVLDNSELNAVEAGGQSRDENVEDVKTRGASASTLEEKPSLEMLPVSVNSKPDIESYIQSKYGIHDVKVGDHVTSTVGDKPAFEILVVPLPATEPSTEKFVPLLSNDLEPVAASVDLVRDAHSSSKKEKPEEETNTEIFNHLQQILSVNIMEEDMSVHVKRTLPVDPYAEDKRIYVKSTLHEDPNVEDHNGLSLPTKEPPTSWKNFRRVLDCWLCFWD